MESLFDFGAGSNTGRTAEVKFDSAYDTMFKGIIDFVVELKFLSVSTAVEIQHVADILCMVFLRFKVKNNKITKNRSVIKGERCYYKHFVMFY